MRTLKTIDIAGGGLAGLTLGIGLRRQGIPVVIREAGHYPRHRVCGEFISGRGKDVLARLGLQELLVRAGAVTARTAAFYLGRAASPVRPLPAPALCLSRLTMDALLAEQFRASGGELRENERCRETKWPEGSVRATGRRLQTRENGWRWLGLKVHARNVPLAADLEMHGSLDGYVGFCRLPHGEVNICGLFRRAASATDSPPPWQELLAGVPGTPLRQRMAEANLDLSSFCSVAGLALQPHRASERPECSIGDALTMVAPVTGNGMSMAFEAAEIAIGPLAAYSRGEVGWAQAKAAIGRACDEAFARRLSWARWLQWFMFAPLLRGPLGSLVLRSKTLWGAMFAHTR